MTLRLEFSQTRLVTVQTPFPGSSKSPLHPEQHCPDTVQTLPLSVLFSILFYFLFYEPSSIFSLYFLRALLPFFTLFSTSLFFCYSLLFDFVLFYSYTCASPLTLSAPQDVCNVTLSLWQKVPQDVYNVITKKSKFTFFARRFSQYFTFYLPFDLFPWF